MEGAWYTAYRLLVYSFIFLWFLQNNEEPAKLDRDVALQYL
jgi:hypothetical protein